MSIIQGAELYPRLIAPVYEDDKDTQTSADACIGGAYNGAFTYYFCKTLRDVQGAITRAELLKRMRAALKHEGYDQIPQLECPAAAKKKKLLED